MSFAGLVADTRDVLSRYVRRFVRNRCAAEDIVQEAFIRTYTHAEPSEPMRPYLFTVARNLASKVRRHDRVVADHLARVSGADLQAVSDSPETAVLADERLRLLNEAIAKLPPQCRAAFTRRMFQDESYKEIAQYLGISVKTVEKHIAHGVREVYAALSTRYRDVESP
jgi:RNA polymerase sigma factor (sigma-70 family)